MQDHLASLRAVESRLRIVLAELRDSELPPSQQPFVHRLVTEAQACLDELVSISDALDEFLRPKGQE